MRTPRLLLTLLALLAAIATACSTTTPSTSQTKPGTTVYPLTITQPDGTTAVIKQRPTRVLMVDIPVFAGEGLVALGVTPIDGETNPPTSRASELTAQYLLLAAFSPGVSDGFVSNPVVKQLDSVQEGRAS